MVDIDSTNPPKVSIPRDMWTEMSFRAAVFGLSVSYCAKSLKKFGNQEACLVTFWNRKFGLLRDATVTGGSLDSSSHGCAILSAFV